GNSARAEPLGGRVKKTQGSTCDRAAFRLVVDVGHTAESPGAKSARGVGEYDFNLRLATLIEQDLLRAGFGKTVLLITDGPTRPGLRSEERRVGKECTARSSPATQRWEAASSTENER